MASQIENVRRRIGWWLTVAIVFLVVGGSAGWFLNRHLNESRKEQQEKHLEEYGLRFGRLLCAVAELDVIGNGGDEETRAHCRRAIEMLALLEPDLYHDVRRERPEPAWVKLDKRDN